MKNTMRKLLAVLLVLVLALSMTTAAFAEGDTADDADPDVTAGTSETAEPGEAGPAEETEGTEEPEDPEEPSDPDSAVPVEDEPGTEPAAAPEEGTEDEPETPADETVYVAQIGEAKYETLDEAVAAASDGATIELLADCTTEGLNLSKDLTINGLGTDNQRYKITFNNKGIALWGKALVFENCVVEMNGIGSTPYSEWSWMAICASKNASLTLNNTTMTIDGTNAGNAHAIYFCSNNKLNLYNNSTLKISNYKQDALEWDGGNGGYNINIVGSTFISDHNRSGFTGTFVASITNSNVQVINSTGNGSNGSHFDIKDSIVNFSDNKDHGLSAGWLKIDHSTVTANNNGANGIHTAGDLTITNGSVVTIESNACSISSKWTIPGALHFGGTTGVIDGGSTVTITGNSGSGIYQKAAGATLTIDPSANVTITNNTAVMLGLGGGLYANGTVNLPDNLVLYNNHAATAADDIYVAESATVTFGPVGSGWALDGTEGTTDCLKAIDGWYEDGAAGEDGTEGSRWTAHDVVYHVVPVTAGTISGTAALKAAHGIPTETVPVDIVLYKLDSVTEKPIPGVEFSVYSDSACKNLITTLTTGTDGSFCLENVQDGVCYLKETKAAPGYKAVADVFTLTVKTVDKDTETTLEDGEVVSKVYPAVSYELKCDTPCIAELEDDNIAIVNDAVVDITIQKVWVDNNNAQGRSKNVEISLRANGKEIEKVVLSDENKWAASYTLPKYDEEGKEIKYSIVELTKVDGYVTGYSTDGFTVYNTLSSLAPKTGDESRLGLWLGLMGLSAACAGAALILGKKHRANG